MTLVTEDQARAAAALIPGVNVRSRGGTWQYEVRFHAPGGKWKRRYAGQSLKRAVDLRIELINTYGADRVNELLQHDPGGKVRIKIPEHWKVGALFSGEGACYREKLLHRWGEGPVVMWCCMNPSTADHNFLDPTVAKAARIASRWGYGAQVIVNACAYRATSKERLLEVKDPVGQFNLESIRISAESVDLIVVAHGQLPKGLQKHADAMVNMLLKYGHTLHVLKLSKDGVPCHPLYIPEAGLVPQVWRTPNVHKEAA